MEMESDKDHIHLLIKCTTQHYTPNIVKAFKGVSLDSYLKNILNLNNGFEMGIFGM